MDGIESVVGAVTFVGPAKPLFPILGRDGSFFPGIVPVSKEMNILLQFSLSQ
jgi:hypothetical protein